jgi:CDP-glucose 4,6-dehydratase
MAFNNIYKNKKVLVTGDTGFKGSWLCSWLLELGANVHGLAKDIPTNPSMFEAIGLADKINHQEIDIRNLEQTKNAIHSIKPDFIFHLAAQAIVSTSYKDPIETLSTNIMGTAHILEALRSYEKPITVVCITSDKAYDNVEWIWGYKETDAVGGKDIYSGSKGGAELVIKSYWHSFLKNQNNIKLGIGRAGNVIGGGDWSTDRIVVDCIKSWQNEMPVELRSPDATRPWQHVLEPLSGYLTLGQLLHESQAGLNGEAFNFGPKNDQNKTVHCLTVDLAEHWGLDKMKMVKVTDNIPFHEAGLLKLNCDKALGILKWQATLDYKTMIGFIVDWYKSFYQKSQPDVQYNLTINQIKNYVAEATKSGLKWTS